jgi:CRP-like cAMP-binding protein
MELRSVIDALGSSAVFGSLAEPDRAAVARRMRRVVYDPGQIIFSRGDPGQEIYLVVEGRVRLSVLTADGLGAQRKRFGSDMTLSIGGPRESEAPGIYALASAPSLTFGTWH